MFGLQQTILIMLWLPQPTDDTSLPWSSGQSSYTGCSLPKEGKRSPLFLMADQGKKLVQGCTPSASNECDLLRHLYDTPLWEQ